MISSILSLFLLYSLANATTGCSSDADCGGVSGSCTIRIEAFKYCSKCGPGNVPINGTCVSTANLAGNTCSSSGCTSCTAGYFLYEGSCLGGESNPGNFVCTFLKLSDTKIMDIDGACMQCNFDQGYIDSPTKSPTEQSCISCSGTYGIEGCTHCVAIYDSATTQKFSVICNGCGTRDKVAIDNKCVEVGSIGDVLSGCKHRISSEITECQHCGVGFLLFAGTCLVANGNIATKLCQQSNQVYVYDTLVCKQCTNTSMAIIDGSCDYFHSDCTCSGGSCSSCNSTQFLYHYGGCYRNSSDLARSICSGGVEEGGKCLACNSSATSGVFTNPNTSSIQTCVACSDTANGGVAHCIECTYSSSTFKCTKCADGSTPTNNSCNAVTPPGPPAGGCNILGCKTCNSTDTTKCAECHIRTYRNLDNTTCLAKCSKLNSGTDYYYGNRTTGACEKCDAACTTCNGPESQHCTACPDGKYVPSDSGSCISCTTTQSPYTGIADCVKCYKTERNTPELKCSACSSGKVPSATQLTCISTPPCLVENCELCQQDKLLCERCVASYYLTPQHTCISDCTTLGAYVGVNTPDSAKCVQCWKGCAKCNSDLRCSECFSDYALVDGRSCYRCNETSEDTQIIGVPNCIRCVAPPFGTGSMHCLEYSSNTNKGGSSNKVGMAIGISVAVLIVLALVGFLVWWFVFRGKKAQPTSLKDIRNFAPSTVNSQTRFI